MSSSTTATTIDAFVKKLTGDVADLGEYLEKNKSPAVVSAALKAVSDTLASTDSGSFGILSADETAYGLADEAIVLLNKASKLEGIAHCNTLKGARDTFFAMKKAWATRRAQHKKSEKAKQTTDDGGDDVEIVTDNSSCHHCSSTHDPSKECPSKYLGRISKTKSAAATLDKAKNKSGPKVDVEIDSDVKMKDSPSPSQVQTRASTVSIPQIASAQERSEQKDAVQQLAQMLSIAGFQGGLPMSPARHQQNQEYAPKPPRPPVIPDLTVNFFPTIALSQVLTFLAQHRGVHRVAAGAGPLPIGALLGVTNRTPTKKGTSHIPGTLVRTIASLITREVRACFHVLTRLLITSTTPTSSPSTNTTTTQQHAPPPVPVPTPVASASASTSTSPTFAKCVKRTTQPIATGTSATLTTRPPKTVELLLVSPQPSTTS
ncbi:hypothetical protein K435DRAFT_875922 [Dendrothele bispora CBS 962.96]|uniref:Uncharacterized protein n=1 Tax=Dendrothele bispora (strain CBS 962.96) TaxID=1314807 RepID=A0A4V4HBD9_DENBC|nr:hypothetical protein K435DRAFT_875922 [Dendrothele bispora CBS 962.96]